MIKKEGKVKVKTRQINMVQRNAAQDNRGQFYRVRCIQDVRTGYDTIRTFEFVCTCVCTCIYVTVHVCTYLFMRVSICVYVSAHNVYNRATLHL